MSRVGRLFEMLGVLRARRRPVTAFELAQALGISERSVYRDVDTLRQLGAPLDGQAGVGFLLRDGFFLPNFAFSPEEMDALVLGLGWVQQRGIRPSFRAARVPWRRYVRVEPTGCPQAKKLLRS